MLSTGVKNNQRLISAAFKSGDNNVYVDSRTLLDYGFDNFYSTTIINKKDYGNIRKVLFSKQRELNYEPESIYKVVFLNNDKEGDYSTNIKLDNINLLIRKGDKIGRLEIYNRRELEQNTKYLLKI